MSNFWLHVKISNVYRLIACCQLIFCLLIFSWLSRIDRRGVIKVADFGLSECVYNKEYFRQTKEKNLLLPLKWMALESLENDVFTEKTDVVRKSCTLLLFYFLHEALGQENTYRMIVKYQNII